MRVSRPRSPEESHKRSVEWSGFGLWRFGGRHSELWDVPAFEQLPMCGVYAPDGVQERGPSMEIKVGGFFGLLVLIADIWAIVNVFGSTASTGAKVLWTVLILLLPVLGFIAWLIVGPRAARST